jgi:hypothetical protein
MTNVWRHLMMLALAYGAVVLRVTLADDLPFVCWTALCVGWACARFSPATATAWGAGIGLMCDLAAQGRLGPHLGAYGLAVGVCLWLGAGRPVWFAPLLGGAVTVADNVASVLIPAWLQSAARINADLLSEIIEQTICTAALAALATGLVRLWRRMRTTSWQSDRPSLANRWTMLHEG